MATSFDVRVWKTRALSGARGKKYQVRWTVQGGSHARTFATAKLAESFRSGLVTAGREGEPFDVDSGLPVRMVPRTNGPTWFEVAMSTVDAKWAYSSPRHRKSTAEGLTTITLALLDGDRSMPDVDTVRLALTSWAFNATTRGRSPEPPADLAEAVQWLRRHSRPLSDLNDAGTLRAVLRACGTRQDGSPSAASTLARKRAALSTALVHAVELGHLDSNPLAKVKTPRRVAEAVDPRVVVNPEQARALLAASACRTPALHAYFACLYYAALRPAEASNLRKSDLVLPESGWGEVLLTGSYQRPGSQWTDDGQPGEERGLKHRARNTVRRVPLAPALVVALRAHLDAFGTGADGRLFVTRSGRLGRPVAEPFVRPVGSSAATRALRLAREIAFTPEQVASPLAARPYDLRHACVSTWLAAGVPAPQVAQWAGHSVAVLLRVYAHAVDGQEASARARIDAALGVAAENSSAPHPRTPVSGRIPSGSAGHDKTAPDPRFRSSGAVSARGGG